MKMPLFEGPPRGAAAVGSMRSGALTICCKGLAVILKQISLASKSTKKRHAEVLLTPRQPRPAAASQAGRAAAAAGRQRRRA
jgi:hypothetical protein